MKTIEKHETKHHTNHKKHEEEAPKRRETMNHTQPYDSQKGFDESKYDMSKGEIASPSVPNPHEPAIAPLPGNQSTGLCVECAKPVAPGQNYVCRDHVRTS